jgi:hypothetical protein
MTRDVAMTTATMSDTTNLPFWNCSLSESYATLLMPAMVHTDSEDGQQVLTLARGGTHLLS